QSGSADVQGGPGVTLSTYWLHGVTAASDGTVYFSDYVRILRMDPSGLVTLVAGSANGGYSGDGGPALVAGMTPYGLWLDQASSTLYFADGGAHRIRTVDLVSGNVRTVAGGSTSSVPPYGDGGLAVNAALTSPNRVAVAGGYLYTGDYGGSYGLRRVKL